MRLFRHAVHCEYAGRGLGDLHGHGLRRRALVLDAARTALLPATSNGTIAQISLELT
jgi:hypothetical protein